MRIASESYFGLVLNPIREAVETLNDVGFKFFCRLKLNPTLKGSEPMEPAGGKESTLFQISVRIFL